MLEVREAAAADALAVAEVHVRAWREGYRDLVDQNFLDGLRPEEWAGRYGFGAMDPQGPCTLVAVDGGQLCGHVTLGTSRDDDRPDSAEIWALYVDPQRWGAGVGRALLDAACRRFSAVGHESAFLWVLTTNLRARRFYAGAGWRPDGRERSIPLGGIPLGEVSYHRVLHPRP